MWKRALVAITAVSLASLIACGDDDSESVSVLTPAQPDRHGCQEVPLANLELLEEGARDGQIIEMINGEAVEAQDLENILIVAALFRLESGDTQVGIWAVNQLIPGALMLSVDETAKQFTDFPDAGIYPTRFGPEDPAAERARACLADES